MLSSACESREHGTATLNQRYGGRLRVVANQAVTVWFNRDRLDLLLASYIGALDSCELLYAIDANGHQASSNIHPDSIDVGAYGQDLSERPYAINLSLINDIASHGAIACGAYTSKMTQRECVTVIHAVAFQSTLLGFVAADFSFATEQSG